MKNIEKKIQIPLYTKINKPLQFIHSPRYTTAAVTDRPIQSN